MRTKGPKVSNKQKKVVSTWKHRLVKIGSNGSRAAMELHLHQGTLSDIMNGKIDPSPEYFDVFETWLKTQEKK